MIEVLAPVAATASRTVSNTGTPATCSPFRPGVTPATTLVPYSTIWVVWNDPSRPVIPCTSSRVSLLTRMLTFFSYVATDRAKIARIVWLVGANQRVRPHAADHPETLVPTVSALFVPVDAGNGRLHVSAPIRRRVSAIGATTTPN